MGGIKGEPKEKRSGLDWAIRESISTAKDLRYPDEVIVKLRAAKSIGEINNILTIARNKYL